MNIFTDIIAIPFGYVMKLFFMIAGGNYMLALLLFTFLVELCMIPLSIKQQKNSIKAASLKPKEMAIRKKYAGREDQQTLQKMNQEIMEMQQKEGYSVFGGCLPLLIQMPLVLALYGIVTNPLKYLLNFSNDSIKAIGEIIKSSGVTEAVAKNIDQDIASNKTITIIEHIRNIGLDAFSSVEGFAEKVPTVDSLPDMTLFGLNLAETPSMDGKNLILLLVPALTFGIYFLTMKLSRKITYQPSTASSDNSDRQLACSNKIMEYSMPIMSASFTFMVPAAVGIYWIFRNIVSTLKQYIVSKLMPLPVFTEEDYKAAEEEFKAKNKPKKGNKSSKERDPNRPKVRSLHHIDDDDYDYVPSDASEKKNQAEVKTEVAGVKIEQAPTQKEDNRKNK